MATEPVPIAQCPFGFANANGQLVCDLEPHHDGVPPGSYLNSCGGCRVAVQDVYDETTGDVTGQTVLECSGCKDGTGNMRERSTSLVIDECVRVGNNHGRLVCENDGQNNPQPDNGDATTTTTASPWTTQLPPGPYLDSCSGCLLETPDTTGKRHSILRCSACNTRPDNPEGRRVPAELVLTRPHKCDEVVNRFGQLRCRVVKQQQQPTTTNNNHKTPQQRVVHTTATTTKSYTIGSSNAQEQQQEQATSSEDESNDDHESSSSSSSLAEEHQQPPPPIAETTHHDEL